MWFLQKNVSRLQKYICFVDYLFDKKQYVCDIVLILDVNSETLGTLVLSEVMIWSFYVIFLC